MSRPPLFCFLALVVASMILPGNDAAARGQGSDVWLVVETPEYLLDVQGLRVPGYEVNSIPGAPKLPVWTTVVEVPAGDDWSLVELGAYEHVLQTPAPLPPAPSLQLRLDRPPDDGTPEATADAPGLESLPDPAIYSVDALYPSHVVQAGPEGIGRGKRLLPIKVYPFQYNPVAHALRYRPRIEFGVHFTHRQGFPRSEKAIAAPAPAGAASQPGLLIHTADRGLYTLTYDALRAAGAPVNYLNPAQLAMSYAGEPVDIEVTGSVDGKFEAGDAVIFYAEPYAGRYMKENVYRLTWSGAPGGRVRTRSAAPSSVARPITTIRRRARVEYDRVYYSTYRDLARDADHFFDNPLYANQAATTAATTYTLALENPVPAGDAEIRVVVHGGQDLGNRSPDQSLVLRLNGSVLGPYRWDGSVSHVITQTVPAASLSPLANDLTIETSLGQLPGIDRYWVSPDWAEILYPARATATGNRCYIEAVLEPSADPAPGAPSRKTSITPKAFTTAFTTQARLYLPLLLESHPAPGSDVAVGGFTAAGVRVYEVSDARHPLLLTDIREMANGGIYSATFAGQANGSYYLSSEGGLLTPAAVQPDPASTLKSPANVSDYIAIVHRSSWDAVQPLLDHRAAEGLRVAKVDVQDIYDEFSGSRVDPEAIREFLSYAYHYWNAGGPRPQYVLLVGDGHYDFKGALRPDLPNLIPPYLLDIDPYIGETAADNRFVSVDYEADFLPDMAIGRIPAKSSADVKAAVDKILAYENHTAADTWQKRAVFVADSKEDLLYDFHGLSDQTRTTLPPLYATESIYYKSQSTLDTAEEMNSAIRGAFNDGALYLQWFGHAATSFWSKELRPKVWGAADVSTLEANTTWPFTASYSCWSGYFIQVVKTGSEQVLAEAMLLTPQKGALADFSPSGKHLGDALVTLDRTLADALFTQRINRVGLAVDAAKLGYFGQSAGPLDLIDTQVLFGDPATKLKLP